MSSTLEKVKSENEILKEKTKLLEEQMTKQAEQHKEYAKERFKYSFRIGQNPNPGNRPIRNEYL